MLKEILNTRQVKGDPKRRWFSDDYFDLIIWLNEQNNIVGFQLCYDKINNERAFTWDKEKGYTHHRIDSGENIPGRFKATPILIDDGIFDYETIANIFKKESKQLDKKTTNFVYENILKYKSV